MLQTFSYSLLTLILSSILLIVSLTLSKKSILDREKSSPFECGFNPKSVARIPFSLRFFMIAIIFLIFDIEITILLPLLVSLNSSNPYSWYFTFMFFMMILLLGLYHEWNQGALNWTP
nr:NADH dehydrogenase subunit 3 [Polionemobius taprobanensis]